MGIYKEAADGLFSLFSRSDSLNILQNKNTFRVRIVKPLEPFSGPAFQFKDDPETLTRTIGRAASRWFCHVEIVASNMTHAKLLDTCPDEATTSTIEDTKIRQSLLPKMLVSSDEGLPNLQVGDIVYARFRPGDNNMIYNLQYCEFVSIDITFERNDIVEKDESLVEKMAEGSDGTVGQVDAAKSSSRDLDSLEPNFKTLVEQLITNMESRGFKTNVVSAYRSLDSQIEKFNEETSKTKYGYHNFLDSGGNPASQAVDLVDKSVGYGGEDPASSKHRKAAEYFKALGEEARKLGFTGSGGIGRWGGDYSQSNPLWAAHGMGWDPAHVELKTTPGQTIAQATENARSAGYSV